MHKHGACCLPIAPIVDQAAQQCFLTHIKARICPNKHVACCSPIESDVNQAVQRFFAKISMGSPLHDTKDSSNTSASVMKIAISVMKKSITGVRASTLASDRSNSTLIQRHILICIVHTYVSYIFTCWRPYRVHRWSTYQVTLSLERIQSDPCTGVHAESTASMRSGSLADTRTLSRVAVRTESITAVDTWPLTGMHRKPTRGLRTKQST